MSISMYTIEVIGAADEKAIYQFMSDNNYLSISRRVKSHEEPPYSDASYCYWGELTLEQVQEQVETAMKESGIEGRVIVKKQS